VGCTPVSYVAGLPLLWCKLAARVSRVMRCDLCWESFDAAGVQINEINARLALRVGAVLCSQVTA